MFKYLVNVLYVLNVLVLFDIFKIYFNGNSLSRFIFLEDDEFIYFKFDFGFFRYNEFLICSF